MKASTASLLLLSSFSAFSENSTFQASAGVALLNMEMDDFSVKGALFSGVANLEPVDYTKGPLELASYLNKTPAIRLFASKYDFNAHNGSDSDSTAYGIFPNVKVMENLLIGAGYNYSKTNHDNENYYSPSRERFSGEATYYLSDASAVGTQISELDGGYTYTLSVSNLLPLQNDDKVFLFASVELDDEEKGEQLITTNLEGKYFLNNKLGLGADYYNYSAETEDGDGNQLNLSVKYFVIPTISVSASVGRSVIDQGDEDATSDLVLASSEFRF